jgi:hypothetical protein
VYARPPLAGRSRQHRRHLGHLRAVRQPRIRGFAGIHFHEGIDILVGAGTKVYAIEDGTVAKVVTALGGNPYRSWVSVATSSDHGWNYVHITPDPALVEGVTKVTQGKTLLGTVIAYPGDASETHLHLDATSGSPDPSFDKVLRPIGDPLALLNPLGDTVGPIVGGVSFMRGEDDNNDPHNLTGGFDTTPASKYKIFQEESKRLTTHGYFKGTDYSKAWIVGHYAGAVTKDGVVVGGTSNIDIIVNATDQITVGGPFVGVRSIEFKAAGQFSGKTIPTVRPFDFAGQFVYDPNRPPGTQDYNALWISDLTRVAYQNDADSPSNAQPPDDISFFHILTNTDGANTVVDLADRNRYWRSKVTQGSAWNDIGSTEAVNNGTAAFPDDYYTITLTARDAAGNATVNTVRVLLDNWVQEITVTPTQNYLEYLVTGKNFLPDAKVPIWGIYAAVGPNDGDQLGSVGDHLDTATTDADGNFSITIALADTPYVSFLADYGADDIYQPRLDPLAPAQTEEGLVQTDAAGFTAPLGGSMPGGGAWPAGPPAGTPVPPGDSGPSQPPEVVAPDFGLFLAPDDLTPFDIPAGEPAVTPGRPAAPPADESSQTVPRPLDVDAGAGVGVSILSPAPGPAPDPFVTLSPGGPDDLSGG